MDINLTPASTSDKQNEELLCMAADKFADILLYQLYGNKKASHPNININKNNEQNKA